MLPQANPLTDVTESLLSYRECARTVWNTYLRPNVRLESRFDYVTEFENICMLLFSSIVLRGIGLPQDAEAPRLIYRTEPLGFLRVETATADVPALVNRELIPSGYWDYPIETLRSVDADLRYIDYYDFDACGVRDFAYVRCRIVAALRLPEVAGRDVLLPAHGVRILLDTN